MKPALAALAPLAALSLAGLTAACTPTVRVEVAPIFQQGFIWGIGSRVEQAGAGLIQGFPYAAPCEDLKLK